MLALAIIALSVFASPAGGLQRLALLDLAVLVLAAVTLDPLVGALAVAVAFVLFHPADLIGHGAGDIWRVTSLVVSLGAGFAAGGGYRLGRTIGVRWRCRGPR